MVKKIIKLKSMFSGKFEMRRCICESENHLCLVLKYAGILNFKLIYTYYVHCILTV